MNEESSIQTDGKRKKQVGSQLGSSIPRPLFFFAEKQGSSKGQLAAASFFAYEDIKRMAARVLHLSAFITT